MRSPLILKDNLHLGKILYFGRPFFLPYPTERRTLLRTSPNPSFRSEDPILGLLTASRGDGGSLNSSVPPYIRSFSLYLNQSPATASGDFVRVSEVTIKIVGDQCGDAALGCRSDEIIR
jgi:hypothetical protein